MAHHLSDALVLLCQSGDVPAVKMALRMGADPRYRNSEALRWASALGHDGVVELLLRDGRAQPRADESEALHAALANGRERAARLLLRDGRAHLEDDGFEGVLLAVERGRERMLERLGVL